MLTTWHSPGLSTNLSWSKMLFSERSQAPSEKSQHAPLNPNRGELEAVEMNRRETTNHFSKEGKEGEKEEEKGEEKGGKKEQKGEEKEEELETFGCLNIVVCLAPQ